MACWTPTALCAPKWSITTRSPRVSVGERRTQDLLEIGAKHVRIGRAVDGHHRVEALDAQGPQHRHMLAIVLGYAPDDPFPGGSAAIEAGHRQMHARFIHELHAAEVERRALLAVVLARLLDARRVSLAGVERLFLRGKPRRWSTRHIVATLTWIPRSSATRAHSSSKVRSALACTNCWTRVCAAASREGRWPPACGLGAMSPVVW